MAEFDNSEDRGEAPEPGRAILIASGVLGAAWIATAVTAGISILGMTYIASLPPESLAMLAAVAVLPALMVILGGVAAREGVRARHEARRLADAASDLINPSARAEMSARRLAVAVRGEITALDRALEQTITKLHEVESSVTRQTHAVNAIAQQAKSGADSMIAGFGRERTELLQIADDLNSQAEMIGQAISRHSHAIAESARIAEQEVRAADELLEARISSFGAAASLISDRTNALTGAAAASADSALRLETALSQALETLAKATSLTDAARQSAEAAAYAASQTAGAVRDTSSDAVEEARRAADLIRTEATALRRDAEDAMARLREAAENARGVARDTVAAVNIAAPAPAAPVRPRTPAPVPPPTPARIAAMKPAVAPTPRAAPPAPPPKVDKPMPSFQRGPAEISAKHPSEPAASPASAPPKPAAAQTPSPIRSEAEFRERMDGGVQPNSGGAWTWRELLSSIDDGGDAGDAPPPANGAGRAPPPRRPEPADDAIARLTQAVSDPRGGAHPIGAVSVITGAGVQIGEVFTVAALDRIAHRSRNGSQSRRKAVKDAVGPAIQRLKDHLRRDERARQEVAGFLRTDGARIAELLARGRASMSADATRAFLLLDAAEG
ncbi:MAG: hypothetical protein GC206_01845 [Alphaproteobacteria bacterium]|nr:hypothetical protein [Alphaproteobacteria bacterium]